MTTECMPKKYRALQKISTKSPRVTYLRAGHAFVFIGSKVESVSIFQQ